MERDDRIYKMGKKNVVADQLSRPVRLVQGEYEENWLGKSKKGHQRNAEG